MSEKLKLYLRAQKDEGHDGMSISIVYITGKTLLDSLNLKAIW